MTDVTKRRGNPGIGRQHAYLAHQRKLKGAYLTKEEKAAHLREFRRSLHYSLSAEEQHALWDLQEGLCPICLATLTDEDRKTHLDHDHETLVVRGFLCGSCNNLLEFAKDNQEILQRACEYLASPPASRMT